MRTTIRFRHLALYSAGGLALLLASSHLAAKPPKRLMAMTPEAVVTAVTINEDPLEPHVVLSTEKVFVPRSMAQNLIDDNHMRAVIDRQSGAIRYEIHQSIRYWGNRRDYATVNYQTPEGLHEAPLTLARHGGDICPNEEVMGACSLTKRVVFEIDERVLQSIAARYAPGSDESWAFKIKDRNGADWNDAIAPAEAAGLIEATRRYRARRS